MTADDTHSTDSEAQRRRLRQRVFGDVLPDITTDEQDEPATGGSGNDDWLRSNVPPHHG